MIQSILFLRSKWTLPDAIKWLEDHGYGHSKVDTTKRHYRFRQTAPTFGKYRTLKLGHGVEFILGF